MTAVVVSATISDDGQGRMKAGLMNRQSTIGNRQSGGFTIVELLSASLLTLLFFGWLTSAYVTVTRALLTWQAEWAVATETQRALATLTRDVEQAVMMDSLSTAGVTLIRSDGRVITYAQRSDGVYRNGQPWGRGGITLTTLHLTGLWAQTETMSGQRILSEERSLTAATDTTVVPPAWVRVTVVGQANQRIATAQTVVRLYCQRPMLLRETARVDVRE